MGRTLGSAARRSCLGVGLGGQGRRRPNQEPAGRQKGMEAVVFHLSPTPLHQYQNQRRPRSENREMVQSPPIIGRSVIRTKRKTTMVQAAAERIALRRRVKQMLRSLNAARWESCFALIDPKIREAGNLAFAPYRDRLREFKSAYGVIQPKKMWINLHLDTSRCKQDKRPFAYVYIVWTDDRHVLHIFQERWVKHEGRWFTRVVGLVAPKRPGATNDD